MVTYIVYGTPQQTVDYIGGPTPLRLNDGSSEVTTDALSLRLEAQAKDIHKENERLNYEFPLLSDPISVRRLILETLNLELPVADLIRAKSTEVSLEYKRFANTQRTFAKNRLDMYRRGRFFYAFDEEVSAFPVAPLITIAEACLDTGISIVDEDSLPPLSVAERWILRETSCFRPILYRHDLSQVPTEDERALYREIIAMPVRANILRYNSQSETGAALDETVNELFNIASTKINSFDRDGIRGL